MATIVKQIKDEPPLIVIVGPTASGKSSVAVELAELHNGEIICADSRTIYKNMDIGTAKPGSVDQSRVPHWGLDIVTPGESFSAADFKAYAVQKIIEIRARGHVPFLVGGTGLYVDGVVFDYQFGPVADPRIRAELEANTLQELHNYCTQHNITLPENDQNKRYVIRAIEQKNITNKRSQLPINNCIIVGIATDTVKLRNQIKKRSEQLFDDGVVNEAKMLGELYGWESEAMTGNIYRLARAYLSGSITQNDFRVKNEIADWHLAKRQLTWLRRNQFIQWMPLATVKNYIAGRLA